MFVTDEGIYTFFKAVHTPKQPGPKDVTELGMFIDFKLWQSAKHPSDNSEIFAFNWTFVSW